MERAVAGTLLRVTKCNTGIATIAEIVAEIFTHKQNLLFFHIYQLRFPSFATRKANGFLHRS